MVLIIFLFAGLRVIIIFIIGSSENDYNKETGMDSDSDASINLVASTHSVQDDLASDGAQNILSLLSTQSSATKGPEIHADVAALLSGFLLKGIDKESRNNAIDSYPVIANCPALLPQVLFGCKCLKTGYFLKKLQSQLAAGISAIAIPLNKQYKITKESLTEETRKELEKKCDPAKIISDVFHALSLHRRHSILPFLDSGVKKILDACPIDDFLFGRFFPDQLKSSNEAQRLGSTIKRKDETPQYLTSKALVAHKSNPPKAGPSGVSTSLNFRYLILNLISFCHQFS
uniref:Uncharacterized protein LOC114345323 n=1 Tax=Diabrotica virgifera virgifera TaxID=50390 RepID=A0A6P7H0I2_DIAVI